MHQAAVLVVRPHCTCGTTFRLDAETSQAAQVATEISALVVKERSCGLHGVSDELVHAVGALANEVSRFREFYTLAKSAGNLVICPSRICLDLVATKVPDLSVDL